MHKHTKYFNFTLSSLTTQFFPKHYLFNFCGFEIKITNYSNVPFIRQTKYESNVSKF
jgi:hypothetical protein